MEKKKRGRPKKESSQEETGGTLQSKIVLKTWKLTTAKSNDGCCCAVLVQGQKTYVKKAQATLFSTWREVLQYDVSDPKGKNYHAVSLSTCFDNTKQWREWFKGIKKDGWTITELI